MNAIAPVTMGFGDIERLAVSIAKSGLFGIKTVEQAIALMAIAQAEGRHPALAARDYDVIQGRPSKKAEAMLRDFMEGGGRCEWHALSDSIADATFSHPQGGSVRITWDMQRAMQAGLGGKDNWKKFPRQMLRSRTVSEGVRTVWPLATSGMYIPEEAADMPPKEQHAGPTIEAQPETERERINREIPMDKPQEPERRSWAQWADSLETAGRDASNDELGRLLAKAEIVEIVRLAGMGQPSPAKTRILTAHQKIEERYLAAPPQPPEPEDDRSDDWPGPKPSDFQRQREAADA